MTEETKKQLDADAVVVIVKQNYIAMDAHLPDALRLPYVMTMHFDYYNGLDLIKTIVATMCRYPSKEMLDDETLKLKGVFKKDLKLSNAYSVKAFIVEPISEEEVEELKKGDPDAPDIFLPPEKKILH